MRGGNETSAIRLGEKADDRRAESLGAAMGELVSVSLPDGETPDCHERRFGQRPQRTICVACSDGRLGFGDYSAIEFCKNQYLARTADSKDTRRN